jgi:hypothetical protein
MDSYLQELKNSLELATEGMSSEQLTWHPANKWCAAEVLEHLYLSYTGTIKGFEKVMQAGKPLASKVSIKQRWQTFVVLKFNYLPEGRKAPAVTQPQGLPVERVRSELVAKIVAMDAIITRCETRFGPRTRLLDHLILGPFTAAQWRKFHLIHGRHHQKQIIRLRDGTPC